MGRYLIIENELKLNDMIVEAVQAIDNNPIILSFATVQAFQVKLSQLKEEEKPEYLKFNLYILNLSDCEPQDWKKTINEIKALGTNKEALMCITAYDSKKISLNFLKQLDVFNTIFKPFDPLILKETLYLALQQGKIAKTSEIKSQKSSAFIGVLKEVEIQSISELGFLTVSDAPIPQNSLTKYFSPLFAAGRKQSVWAQCLLSAPHPEKPGHFINKFQFYHVKKDLLMQLRKYVNSKKAQESSSAFWHLENRHQVPPLKLALVAERDSESDSLRKDLIEHFVNIDIEVLDCTTIDSWPRVLEHQIVLNLTDLPVDQFKFFFKEATFFLWHPKSEPKEDQLKKFALTYSEIFSRPLDRSFFYKKMKVIIPELKTKEPLFLSNVTCREIIKAANTIKVSEVNEVFINFYYSRELEMRSFREFIFVKDEYEHAIEIPAFCHSKEKSKSVQSGDKNIFFHQFIFFAMTDHFQKEIRLWLLQNYIQQNKKEE